MFRTCYDNEKPQVDSSFFAEWFPRPTMATNAPFSVEKPPFSVFLLKAAFPFYTL